MRIGIPKEIKPQEGRVAMLPRQVEGLTALGHQVLVQEDAGLLSGAPAADYSSAGATLVNDGAEVFAGAELIVKVKEILPAEFELLRPEHVLLTNIHGAADRPQIDRLLAIGPSRRKTPTNSAPLTACWREKSALSKACA